jgi:polyhydroxyalkanoate synthesis repressor PhaR
VLYEWLHWPPCGKYECAGVANRLSEARAVDENEHNQSQACRNHGDAMNTQRRIMKYTNRRLYDTLAAKYVTLGDIRELVLNRVEFSVFEQNSRMDITDRILLRVLVDRERGAEPILSRDQLLQMIRSCPSPTATNVTEALEQAA